MNRNKTGSKAAILGLLIMAVVFAVLLVRLFALRFETGDSLPPYSSLRSDPLGTRALFESLKGLPQVTAERHFESLAELTDPMKADGRSTVFILGLNYWELCFLSEEEIKTFDRLVLDGGRLVIACFPAQKKSVYLELLKKKKVGEEPDVDGDESPESGKDNTPEKKTADAEAAKGNPLEEKPKKKTDRGKGGDKKDSKGKKTTDKRDSAKTEPESLEHHWGFKFDFAGEEEDLETALAGDAATPDWPEETSWHSRLYFDELDKAWQVLYTAGEKPVTIERRVGRGSVVLMGDSYLFSNEAMQKERYPELLAGLASPGHGDDVTVIFDESHFGMIESDNVAVLVRRYRLHWPLVALIVLAGLYIWKSAVSLVPPPGEEQERSRAVHASGRDSFSGLVSLMRRSVDRRDILKTCYDEWRNTYSLDERRRELLERVEAEIEARSPGAVKKPGRVEGYRTICGLLSEGRPWKKARTS